MVGENTVTTHAGSANHQLRTVSPDDVVERLTHGALAAPSDTVGDDGFREWWHQRRQAAGMRVRPTSFSELDSWDFDAHTGDLAHRSGRFFAVTGLRIRRDGDVVREQPILDQPETGVLGLLVSHRDGVLHVLVQAKTEPGNINGPQLSPTVQATASNQSRVHRGAAPPYLEYFTNPPRGGILIDSLQSEQGIWFWQKQNRNMVVAVPPTVAAQENFRWIPLTDLRRLISIDNLLNMDARSVLGCLPLDPTRVAATTSDPFRHALRRSYAADEDRSGEDSVLRWLTAERAASPWQSRLVPLAQINGWDHSAGQIADQRRRDFRIVASHVHARSREVPAWSQPLLRPRGQGHCVLVVRIVGGVLHLLMRAAPEPGLRHVVELAPTVRVPGGVEPCARDTPTRQSVLQAAFVRGASRVRFDTLLSEEGGRFHHACTHYRIVEVGADSPTARSADLPSDYRWVTVGQLLRLVRHGHELTVETRTFLACLHSLW